MQWCHLCHGAWSTLIQMPSFNLNLYWSITYWISKDKLKWLLSQNRQFLYKKMHFSMLSAKCWPFCSDLSVLNLIKWCILQVSWVHWTEDSTSVTGPHVSLYFLYDIHIYTFLYKKNMYIGHMGKSWRCGCLVTWFCYQLIARPGIKTAAHPWPDPYFKKKSICSLKNQHWEGSIK